MHKKSYIHLLTACLLSLGLCGGHAAAGTPSLAMVADIEGRITLQHGDSSSELQFGDTLVEGDVLTIPDQARVVVVYFDRCSEWVLNKPDAVEILAPGPRSRKSGSLKPARKLPICDRPEEFKHLGSQVIGGVVMRGLPPQDIGVADDPAVASLRREAERDGASTTAILSLMLHDLKKQNLESAERYYVRLKRRHPEAGLVKEFAHYFADTQR